MIGCSERLRACIGDPLICLLPTSQTPTLCPCMYAPTQATYTPLAGRPPVRLPACLSVWSVWLAGWLARPPPALRGGHVSIIAAQGCKGAPRHTERGLAVEPAAPEKKRRWAPDDINMLRDLDRKLFSEPGTPKQLPFSALPLAPLPPPSHHTHSPAPYTHSPARPD